MTKTAFAALLLLACIPVQADEVLKTGQFKAVLQEDNALLPGSIRWLPENIELLKPAAGLNFNFTSFEFRNKIYHDENRALWAGKDEPRFFTDVTVIGKTPRTDGPYSGLQVELESSYARSTRSLLFHSSEPRFRIEYAFEFTRDVIVHETEMLGIVVRFNEGFNRVTVGDARGQSPALLTATGLKDPDISATLLEAGPRLLTCPAKKVSLLIQTSHAGVGLDQPPVNLLSLKKGQRLTITIDGCLGPQDDPVLLRQMAEAQGKLSAANRAYALVETARVLAQLDKIDEAEAALLQAGELNKQYATPYGVLAALRRGHKLTGDLDADLEAGYRMPYNYGYMLSGIDWAEQKGVTEEQRRLHQFNLLITVENTVFYPDYYLWIARGFLKMNMTAQACAMYRQALWAADFMPRQEKTRDKLKQDCQKEIAALETIMKTRTCTNLPPLIPLRRPAAEKPPDTP